MANASHSHSEYASANHTHTASDISGLSAMYTFSITTSTTSITIPTVTYATFLFIMNNARSISNTIHQFIIGSRNNTTVVAKAIVGNTTTDAGTKLTVIDSSKIVWGENSIVIYGVTSSTYVGFYA